MSIAPARLASIRRAEPDDDSHVAALFHALHAFNASLDARFVLADGWEALLREHLAHERAHGHGITYLAHVAERPVGLLMMEGHTDAPLFRHRHWAEIVALYVVPAARGEGIADALLAEGFAWARDHGYNRVQLYVTSSNAPAKRFYQRSGFQPIQEILSRALELATGEPEDDPTCEAAYAHGQNLLSGNRHRLALDEAAGKEGQPRSDAALRS